MQDKDTDALLPLPAPFFQILVALAAGDAHGYAIMQAMIAQGVIGDFRAPDILRFGITPLFVGEAEIDGAIAALSQIMASGSWDRPEFKARAKVT